MRLISRGICLAPCLFLPSVAALPATPAPQPLSSTSECPVEISLNLKAPGIVLFQGWNAITPTRALQIRMAALGSKPLARAKVVMHLRDTYPFLNPGSSDVTEHRFLRTIYIDGTGADTHLDADIPLSASTGTVESIDVVRITSTDGQLLSGTPCHAFLNPVTLIQARSF